MGRKRTKTPKDDKWRLGGIVLPPSLGKLIDEDATSSGRTRTAVIKTILWQYYQRPTGDSEE